MAPKRLIELMRAIQNRLSLTPAMQVAIRYLGLFTAYFTALGGTILAMWKLKVPIAETFETDSQIVFYAISFAPIASVFVLHSLPSVVKEMRRLRRNAAIVMGRLKKDYCRLTPFDEEDQGTYKRLDGAHEKVFDWILKTAEPILFLSGMSGCGKSSLLNASVLPRLKKESPAYVPLLIRSFEDPVNALRGALFQNGLIEEYKETVDLDIKDLLEAACGRLKDRRLLILFDQFEELLVVHGEEGGPTQRILALLRDLKRDPIECLTVLVVFRTEYQGLLIEAGLGHLNSEKNWHVVDPFITSDAASFLEESGLELEDDQITTILTEASLYEKTRGFVRPITLNMIGLALNRIAVPKRTVAGQGFDAGGILLNYTAESLDSADPKGFARLVMKHMLSADGTKVPQTISELHEKTKLKHGSIKSLMLNCATAGLVRLVDESRSFWEISHDFVANLIARAIGRDDRTLAQKARPWVLAFLLMGWVAFAAVMMTVRPQRPQSFIEILKEMELRTQGTADYDPNEGVVEYDPNNGVLTLAKTVRDSDIAKLRPKDEFKKLTSLTLNSSLGVTDASLAYLKGLRLTHLDLHACTAINDAGLEHLKDMPLVYLSLSNCTRIGDRGLEKLKGFSELRELSLVYCERVTTGGLKYLKNMPLERLDLSMIYQIDDTSIEVLRNMDMLKDEDLKLRQLNVAQCERITDACIKYIEGMKLEQFGVDQTSITTAGRGKLEAMGIRTTVD